MIVVRKAQFDWITFALYFDIISEQPVYDGNWV